MIPCFVHMVLFKDSHVGSCKNYSEKSNPQGGVVLRVIAFFFYVLGSTYTVLGSPFSTRITSYFFCISSRFFAVPRSSMQPNGPHSMIRTTITYYLHWGFLTSTHVEDIGRLMKLGVLLPASGVHTVLYMIGCTFS